MIVQVSNSVAALDVARPTFSAAKSPTEAGCAFFRVWEKRSSPRGSLCPWTFRRTTKMIRCGTKISRRSVMLSNCALTAGSSTHRARRRAKRARVRISGLVASYVGIPGNWPGALCVAAARRGRFDSLTPGQMLRRRSSRHPSTKSCLLIRVQLQTIREVDASCSRSLILDKGLRTLRRTSRTHTCDSFIAGCCFKESWNRVSVMGGHRD